MVEPYVRIVPPETSMAMSRPSDALAEVASRPPKLDRVMEFAALPKEVSSVQLTNPPVMASPPENVLPLPLPLPRRNSAPLPAPLAERLPWALIVSPPLPAKMAFMFTSVAPPVPSAEVSIVPPPMSMESPAPPVKVYPALIVSEVAWRLPDTVTVPAAPPNTASSRALQATGLPPVAASSQFVAVPSHVPAPPSASAVVSVPSQ